MHDLTSCLVLNLKPPIIATNINFRLRGRRCLFRLCCRRRSRGRGRLAGGNLRRRCLMLQDGFWSRFWDIRRSELGQELGDIRLARLLLVRWLRFRNRSGGCSRGVLF